jgi:hypothetical protein
VQRKAAQKWSWYGGTGKEGRVRRILTILVLAARRGLPLPLMEGRRFSRTSQGHAGIADIGPLRASGLDREILTIFVPAAARDCGSASGSS